MPFIITNAILVGLAFADVMITRRAPDNRLKLVGARRSIWDYSSAFVWSSALTLFGLMAALDLIAASQSPDIAFSLLGASQRWPALSIGGALAASALAIPIMAFVVAHLAVRAPMPAVSTRNPSTRQRYLDFLRARQVGALAFGSVFAGAMYLFLTLTCLSFGPPSRVVAEIGAFDRRYAPLFAPLLFISGVILFLPGIMSGQLGGRLTGWWWRRAPEPRERPAAEGEVDR